MHSLARIVTEALKFNEQIIPRSLGYELSSPALETGVYDGCHSPALLAIKLVTSK